MLALLGLAIISVVLGGIMSKRMSPLVALVIVPFAGALLAGYTPAEASLFIVDGLRSIVPVTGMIIFAVLYFGVVSDAGMLDPIIGHILRTVGSKPARITTGTALLALIIHMDGSGAVTILLTVPAFMPLYDRLGMDRRVLACIISLSAGINFLPWTGPMVRAAITVNTPSADIFFPLIPVQICGLALMFALSYWFGKREEKRLRIDGEKHRIPEGAAPRFELTGAQRAVRRPKLFWLNIVITGAVLLAMILRVVDAAVAFMTGLALALSINYPKMDDQMARIEAHARPALVMGSILLSAGAFVGVMKHTGIISAMALTLVNVIPPGAEGHIPFVVGLFSTPLSLFFDPDSFYFGVLPVIAEAYKTLGGDPVLVARAATLGVYSTGFGITPLTPSCLLLIGLTQLNLADHQRFSLPYLWGSSIFMTLVAAAIGVFPF